MKIYTLLILMVCYTCSIFAQDKVVLRNGEELNVKVTMVGTDCVQFQYPGETVVNQKTKNEVRYILYENGRKEKITSSVDVPIINPDNWKKEWEKVIVTYVSDDVEGLTRVDNIQSTSTWGGLGGGQGLGYKRCIKGLKKKAAKLGAGIILITDRPSKLSGVTVVGTCYK